MSDFMRNKIEENENMKSDQRIKQKRNVIKMKKIKNGIETSISDALTEKDNKVNRSIFQDDRGNLESGNVTSENQHDKKFENKDISKQSDKQINFKSFTFDFTSRF